jgi:uncharacterized protein YyaL (SSP411 family)
MRTSNQNETYKKTVEETLTFVERELMSSEGAFTYLTPIVKKMKR